MRCHDHPAGKYSSQDANIFLPCSNTHNLSSTTLPLISLCCFHPGEGKRLALWSQMPGLPQDQLCQIQTDISPKADTQSCLKERSLLYSFLLFPDEKLCPCQPNVGCCSDASPELRSQGSDSEEGEGTARAQAH